MNLMGLGLARKNKSVPKPIRWIALARATRWLGWGFGETLLPVFIAGLSTSLLEAGVVSAVYDAALLISLPVVAWLADTRSSKSLILADLLLYPFVGISYYLAGSFGALGFVVFARFLNGLAYSLDTVGVSTYLRRMARPNGIAGAFGYTASFANLSWLAAALAGAVLLRFVRIHILLLLVAPFALVAILPLHKARRDRPQSNGPRSFAKYFRRFAVNILAVKSDLRRVLVLAFLFEFASIASTFFIPIAAYRSGANLSEVALMCVLSSAPALCEYWLAWVIDGEPKKGQLVFVASIAALPLLFILAAFVPSFRGRAVAAFGIGMATTFGILAIQEQATRLSHQASYGEVSGLVEGALSLSDLSAPVALGLVADLFGLNRTFALCAGAFFIGTLMLAQSPPKSLT